MKPKPLSLPPINNYRPTKLSAAQEEPLFDPQTSGGLLVVVADQADALVRELRETGIGQAVIIGQILASVQAGIRAI